MPRQWALRAGLADWLGCTTPQYLDPVGVRRILEESEAKLEDGIALSLELSVMTYRAGDDAERLRLAAWARDSKPGWICICGARAWR
jgi:hypothetical protein